MGALGSGIKITVIAIIIVIIFVFVKTIGLYNFNLFTIFSNAINQIGGNSIDRGDINLSAVIQKLSPNGSSLYLLKNGSNEEKFLFSHSNYFSGRETNPTVNISPDDKSLLTEDGTGASNGPIYVVNLFNGTKNQIGEGFKPYWFNNGKSVIYLRWTGTDKDGCNNFKKASIYSVDRDGTNERLISGPDELITRRCFVATPSISPDGTRLLFINVKGSGKGTVLNLTNNTSFEVNLGNKFQKLGTSNSPLLPTSGVFSSWSPDSQKFILIFDGYIIGLYNKDGHSLNYYKLDDTNHGVIDFIWLFDNKHLVFNITEDRHPGSIFPKAKYLAIFNTDNNILRTVYKIDAKKANEGNFASIVTPLSGDTYLFETRRIEYPTDDKDQLKFYVGNSKGFYKYHDQIGTKTIGRDDKYYWYEEK